MGIILVTFLVIFLLIASGGLLLFYREVMLKRISEAITPRRKQKSMTSVLAQTKFSIGQIVERFDQIMPKSEKEVSVVTQRLARAGYRDEKTMKFFYGCKVVLPVLLCAGVFFSGYANSMGQFFVYILALGIGFLAPDFWLGKKIEARQKRITRGLPDVLDLLVICMEAGLSMDQATARTAAELSKSTPDLSDELGVVVLEQRAGLSRAEAWKRMAARTEVESIRNLVAILVQTEQFGTSIAKMLRVHADTLRTQRVQMIEELAAKTSVKLVFPLVLFIFPALFLVTLGPAMIVMMEQFGKMNGH